VCTIHCFFLLVHHAMPIATTMLHTPMTAPIAPQLREEPSEDEDDEGEEPPPDAGFEVGVGSKGSEDEPGVAEVVVG
jgi:hypothetical protein